MFRCTVVVGSWIAFLAGCGPELGSCDPNAARSLVYEEGGGPATEGQALMIQSCGYGAFCHAENIEIENRFGVPAGLDYDLNLASYSSMNEPEQTDRLRRMQSRVFNDRHAFLEQVMTGRMPVPGAAGEAALEGAPIYNRLDPVTGNPTPMPTIDTEEGRDVLRNWLACATPVVVRTEPPDEPDDPPLAEWETAEIREVQPLEPNWTDIYTRLIDRRCNSDQCHGGTDPDAGLNLQGQAEALNALLTGTSETEMHCMGESFLVPTMPEQSLFLGVLSSLDDVTGEPGCAERVMPLGGARVSAESRASIRQWITDGANP